MNSEQRKDPGKEYDRRSVRRRSGRHRKHSKRKGKIWMIFKWLGRNPLKAIAFLLLFVFIYLTILFFLYNGGKNSRTTIYTNSANK
jgi:hypothetical protein